MERINVAELLKDCPKGMKINCLMYDGCTFEGIIENDDYPIKIQAPDISFVFTKYGSMSEIESAKCVIFPKGKNTWEGFVPPCKFKDGDIVATSDGAWIGITAGGVNKRMIPTYCIIKSDGKFEAYFNRKNVWCFDRLATEEEKEALFNAIKKNGYSWNAETKTLEKVEPKFDITTLKPFDKVLVRDKIGDKWMIEFFSHIRNAKFMFACATAVWGQCVPYEGNEHLLNTTDNCADFYITWNN